MVITTIIFNVFILKIAYFTPLNKIDRVKIIRGGGVNIEIIILRPEHEGNFFVSDYALF